MNSMLTSYPQQTLSVSKYGTIWLDKNTASVSKDITRTGMSTMHYNTGVHFRLYALKQNHCGYIWIIAGNWKTTLFFTNIDTPKQLNSSVMNCEKWQREKW